MCVDVHAQRVPFCDSIYKEERTNEKSNIVFCCERMPSPILDKKIKESYFHPVVSDTINFNKSQYTVIVKYIVDIDSTAKCIIIMKSDDQKLDETTIDRIKKLKFIPAKQNGKLVPCVDSSIFYYTIIPHN